MPGPTRRVLLLFVLAIGAGLLAGCDLIGLETFGFYNTDISGVDFAVVDESGSKMQSDLTYSPGEGVYLRLENTTDIKIGINLSCSIPQRQTSEGKWKAPEATMACPLYLVELKPGEARTKEVDLPQDRSVDDGTLDAGTYRFVTEVSDQTSEERRKAEVATQSFELVRE